jgi:hypothetical protein
LSRRASACVLSWVPEKVGLPDDSPHVRRAKRVLGLRRQSRRSPALLPRCRADRPPPTRRLNLVARPRSAYTGFASFCSQHAAAAGATGPRVHNALFFTAKRRGT